MRLVLTEICDECDVERPTELCDSCDGAYCEECMPDHECDPASKHDFFCDCRDCTTFAPAD